MATVYKRPRSPYWYARITVGGDVRRISTGSRNQREAKKIADNLEEEANQLVIRPGELYLKESAERFFIEKDLAPKTVKNYRCSLGNLVSKLGNFPLKALNEEQIRHYVGVRRLGTGDVAIRRDLAFLSSLYTHARHWEGGPTSNPAKAYDKRGLRDAKAHTRWLSHEQFDRLLAACTEDYQRTLLILAVDTGMRHSELLGLTWDEVDLRRREIRLGNLDRRRTKNQSYRIIPLTDRVVHALCRTPRHTTPLVFPTARADPKTGRMKYTARTSIKKFVNGSCERAGLPHLRIHDLRHTFASWALQSGMPEIVVQEILGHKTRSMTKRYAHVSNAQLHDAIRKFQSTLGQPNTTDEDNPQAV